LGSLPDSPRTQMATPATAMQLLEQLRAVSYPAAKQDYEELSAFADGQVCSLSLSRTWPRPMRAPSALCSADANNGAV